MGDTPNYPNWFDGQKYNFENHLLKFKGEPDLRFLQIGTYTGDASEWLLTNVLTDQSSILVDVDTWEGSDELEHKSISFSEVYEFYKKRMEPYPNVRSVRNNSENFLTSNKERSNLFDFIYIDGDHTEKAVYADAVNAWPLLKTQGILAFDDYLWGQDVHPSLRPKIAIDTFLEEKQGEYVLLSQDYQVWVQKR
jgi:hypothetical protein